MNRTKLIFSVGIALGIGIAVGCGSSSNGPGPMPDGGANEEASGSDAGSDASEGNSCNPLLGELCPQGQTCCSSGLRGTCVDVGSCASPFQIGCVSAASCGSGVCCGSVQLPAGFDASAFRDASSFDAGEFDASEFGLTLVCATSCAPGEFQLCASAHDCPAGESCGGASMMGGVGVPLVLACFPTDAGQGLDSSTDSGPSEASTADAAVESDASDGG